MASAFRRSTLSHREFLLIPLFSLLHSSSSLACLVVLRFQHAADISSVTRASSLITEAPSRRQLVLLLSVPSDVRRESVWPSYCQEVVRKETHECEVFKSNSLCCCLSPARMRRHNITITNNNRRSRRTAGRAGESHPPDSDPVRFGPEVFRSRTGADLRIQPRRGRAPVCACDGAGPESPMPHWGIALALGPNYNLPPMPEREEKAWKAIAKRLSCRGDRAGE